MSLTLGVIAPPPSWNRPVGDAGNADSYDQDVIFHHVEGLSSSMILRPVPNPDLLPPYLSGAKALADRGAQVVGTTCGFLSPLQDEIARTIGVPFVSSALLQIGLAHQITGRRVGIITADSHALTPAYLAAAGAPADVPVAIVGLQDYPAFTASAVKGTKDMDHDAVEAAMIEAAGSLVAAHDDLGAFVLECHNLPPFTPAIRRAFGLPVFDVLTMMRWAASGLE